MGNLIGQRKHLLVGQDINSGVKLLETFAVILTFPTVFSSVCMSCSSAVCFPLMELTVQTPMNIQCQVIKILPCTYSAPDTFCFKGWYGLNLGLFTYKPRFDGSQEASAILCEFPKHLFFGNTQYDVSKPYMYSRDVDKETVINQYPYFLGMVL